MKKSEQKIVGENEVLFDLFYCPSVWFGEWIGWLGGWMFGRMAGLWSAANWEYQLYMLCRLFWATGSGNKVILRNCQLSDLLFVHASVAATCHMAMFSFCFSSVYIVQHPDFRPILTASQLNRKLNFFPGLYRWLSSYDGILSAWATLITASRCQWLRLISLMALCALAYFSGIKSLKCN